MAPVRWALFAVFLACCGGHLQHNHGYPQRKIGITGNRTPYGSPYMNLRRQYLPKKQTLGQYPYQQKRQQLGQYPYQQQQPKQLLQQRTLRPTLHNAIFNNQQEQKCYTIARRPFYMVRMLTYPCNRRVNGVPVIRMIRGPNGPLCLSYFRVPMYQYYRIQACCPGWGFDKSGRCTIRTSQQMPSRMPYSQRTEPNRMMDMASRMRMAMWHRAQRAMAARREMLAMRMNRFRQMNEMPRTPQMEEERPPMSPMAMILIRLRQRLAQSMDNSPFSRIKINRLQRQRQPMQMPMHRPSTPPVPHPVQRPPLTRRIIKIRKNQIASQPSRFPQIHPNFPQEQHSRPFPQIPRRVLPGMMIRNRMPMPHQMNPMARMQQMKRMHQMHQMQKMLQMQMQQQRVPMRSIQMPSPFSAGIKPFPQIPSPSQLPREHFHDHNHDHHNHDHHHDHHHEHPSMPIKKNPFPQIPASSKLPRAHYQQHDHSQHIHKPFPQIPEAPTQEPEEESPSLIDIGLPDNEVQMTDTTVQEEPINDDSEPEPMDQNLTEPELQLNDPSMENDVQADLTEPWDLSNDEPQSPANDGLVTDNEPQVTDEVEPQITDEVEPQVTDEFEPQVTDEFEPQTEDQIEPDTVKEVKAEPKVKLVDTKPEDTKAILDTAPAEIDATDGKKTEVNEAEKPEQPVQPMKQVIKHEVDVQELTLKEFYLPLLIGTGVGFLLLVLVLSLVICCCCKRRLRKKMKMAKEEKKPGALDGIYTIGVPPPMYEVNGIPPISYEEAKGEKISVKDEPATIPVNEVTENTPM